MRKIFLISIIFLAAGCQQTIYRLPVKPEPIACTQEAKLCPDGSSVGRTGPNCEFAQCPAVPVSTSTPPSPGQTGTSGILGNVLLGPTCPVERIPPDPACAPKGYQATIIVKSADGQKEITRFTSKSGGSFKVSLAPATYLLVPVSAAVYPRGSEQTVTVEKNKFTEVIINFDSGIR